MRLDRLKLHLNSPWQPCLVAMIANLALVLTRLAVRGNDPSIFVTAGDFFVDRQSAPASLSILNDSFGYDGQFYYRLALDPLTSEHTAFGITLDAPEVRQQRITYPIVVAILSFGRAGLVPIMLIAVNLLALGAIGYLGGLWVKSIGQSALWGVVFPLYTGFQFSLARDLTEILAIGLLLTSLYLARLARSRAATGLLVLAVLTRETTVAVALAAAMIYFFGLITKKKAMVEFKWYYFAIPIAVYAAWQLTLYSRWGALPITVSSQFNVGRPFIGLVQFGLKGLGVGTPFNLRGFGELGLVLSMFFLPALAWRTSTARPYEKLAWLLLALLAVNFASGVTDEDISLLRVLADLFLFSAIVVFNSPSKIRWLFGGFSVVMWIVSFQYAVNLY